MLANVVEASDLQQINEINCTERELDVLTCILNGRSSKKAANFLGISHRTVEVHLRNIRSKLGCYSKEEIIDFIEKSKQLHLIKNHYSYLLTKIAFEKELLKITKLIQKLQVGLVHFGSLENKRSTSSQIIEHLDMAGIKITKINWEKTKSFVKLNDLLITTPMPLVFIINKEYSEILTENNFNIVETINRLQVLSFNSNIKIILLITEQQDLELPQLHPNTIIINNSKYANYYLMFFELLQTLLNPTSIATYIEKFNNQSNILNNQNKPGDHFEKHENQQHKTNKLSNIPWKWAIFLISPICFSLVTYKINLEIKSLKTKHEHSIFKSDTVSLQQTLANNKDNKQTSSTNNTSFTLTTWNLPFPNNFFTGRQAELKKIINLLEDKNEITTVTLVACNGLGGVGKTELAKYIIHNIENLSQEKYKLKIWFDSEKINNLIAQYLKFAKQIGIHIQDQTNVEEIITQVKLWLENNHGWFIVYDNAENIDNIMHLIPHRGGKILITSRNPNWPNSVNIDTLTEQDAVMLVKKILVKPENTKDVQKLANVLGRLPLAISQASAYISRKGISIKNYIKEFEQEQHRLMADHTMPPGNTHNSVAITFAISIDTIKKISFEGYFLINCLAYLDPNSLYRKDFLRFMPDEKQINKNIMLDKAIESLRDYSLINITDNKIIKIHRLVQIIAWYRQLNLKENNKWLFKVLDVVNDNTPDDHLVLGAAANKKECILIIIEHYKEMLKKNKTASLLQGLGCCYLVAQNFPAAEKCFLESIKLKPNSSIYCEYGMALYRQKKLDGAIEQFEKSINMTDDYDSYFSEMERPSLDLAIQDLIYKYGIVRIKAKDLAAFFLLKIYNKIGTREKSKFYADHLAQIASNKNQLILKELLDSLE